MYLLRWVSLFLAVAASGCNRHPASAGECEALLNRLIEIELSESGYRDPVLRTRWQNDFGHRFAVDLDRCRGRDVRSSLRSCLARAQSSEEIIHGCLD